MLASVLGMMTAGATHVAVATDHVIESFRNQLWAGYKSELLPIPQQEQFLFQIAQQVYEQNPA